MRFPVEDAFRSMSLEHECNNNVDGLTLEPPLKRQEICRYPSNELISQEESMQEEEELDSEASSVSDGVDQQTKDAVYRLVFGRTKKEPITENPVDAKIEEIIRQSRLQAFRELLNTNSRQVSDGITRDDFDVQMSQQIVPPRRGSMRRSKSFDDLDVDMLS